MVAKLKKKHHGYRDLTFGQPYVVIGIEADELRILNDAGRPVSSRTVYSGRFARTG